MPRLTQSLPKYRKHRASGQAVVTLHGADHYLGPHNSRASKQLYDRLIVEYCAAGRARPATEHEITVIEVIARYWRFAQGYYVKGGKPTSELAAIRCAVRSLKRLYGPVPAVEFGPVSLKALREHWITEGHARRTINQNVGRVVRMFRWAAAEELLPPTVHQALAALPGLRQGRSAARETPPIQPVDIAIVQETLLNVSPIVADMIRLQLLTGARPGEICGLRPSDIDRSGDVWEYRVGGHKTEHHGRGRTVFIGPEAQQILTPYLRRADEAHCFSPAEVVDQQRQARHASRSTPLKCGNRPGHRNGAATRKGIKARAPGNAYTPDSYRRAVHYACDKAFPPPEDVTDDSLNQWRSDHRWSPNQLRHAAATEIRKRFGLEAAQVILGHAAADVTQVYAERDAEKARQVARQVG